MTHKTKFGYWRLDSYMVRSENFLPTSHCTLPEISPPLGGRGFTLLDRSSVQLQGLSENLSNRVKGRGDQKVFILSTPTLTLPHRKRGGK
jgi:hypothetical protein